MAIPARVHFCWIGSRLPWAYVFAVVSAAERSGMAEIILHHTDALSGPEAEALSGVASVTLQRINPMACLAEAGAELCIGERLAALYRELENPAARADVLRAAILLRQGGIYLDLDTITVASLVPLLDARHFVGSEYIVWPHAVRVSRAPGPWLRALSLDLMRKAMRRAEGGWQSFRLVQRLYFRAANNAVMGAEPGSPFFAHYLRAMAELPPETALPAYALGPDLLQRLIEGDPQSGLAIHDPDVFYPLPPEISEHWFRLGNRVALERVLRPETRVVHWYASVRTSQRVALVSPAYVREHRGRQLYSALVCAHVANLPDG